MTTTRHFVELGQRFGKLTVIELDLRLHPKNPFKSNGRPRTPERAVRVRCDCGTEKVIKLTNLLSPKVRQASCNQCLSGLRTESRDSSQYLYHMHRNILRRCYNQEHPAYPGYGGRGITMDSDWLDYESFQSWVLRELGERPLGMSFDRIDVNGNYEPGNVRWATIHEQMINKRPRGPRVPLPQDKIREALARYDAGGVTYRELAKDLGFPEMSLANAVRRLRRSQQ